MIEVFRPLPLVLAAALGAMLVTASPDASAQSADALIDEGISLREQKKDEDALLKFRMAYTISKGARAMAQIALAEQALGRWVDAETHLKEALAATEDAWITKNRAPLEQALAFIQEHLGGLEIIGLAGAEVYVDGKKRGVLPLAEPLRVEAGSAVVEVRAEGHHTQSRTLRVSPGGLARESVELVAKTPAAPDPKKAPATTAQTEPAPRDSSLMPWPYVTAGGAVAAVGAGFVFMAVRNSNINEYNDDSVCLGGGMTRDQNCGDKLSTANTMEALSIVSFVVGGLLAAGSVTLFVLDGGGDDARANQAPSDGPAWAIGDGPGDLGLSLNGRF